MKQPNDSDYKKIRDDFLATGEMKAMDLGDLMVRDGKIGFANVLVFIGGLLLVIVPIVILIVLFVKKKKEESASELW